MLHCMHNKRKKAQVGMSNNHFGNNVCALYVWRVEHSDTLLHISLRV